MFDLVFIESKMGDSNNPDLVTRNSSRTRSACVFLTSQGGSSYSVFVSRMIFCSLIDSQSKRSMSIGHSSLNTSSKIEKPPGPNPIEREVDRAVCWAIAHSTLWQIDTGNVGRWVDIDSAIGFYGSVEKSDGHRCSVAVGRWSRTHAVRYSRNNGGSSKKKDGEETTKQRGNFVPRRGHNTHVNDANALGGPACNFMHNNSVSCRYGIDLTS